MIGHIRVSALFLAFCCAAGGQPRTEENSGPGIWWNIANFIILVGILGYLTKKNLGPFFKSRGEQIESALAEGAKAKREGEERVAEMERRIAGLSVEIERLRADMRQEMAAEGERVRLETERHLNRIQQQAEQEIESMFKTARRQLKMYSAELALKAAEQQLEGRITKEVENNLVTSFIQDLRSGEGPSAHN